MNNVETILSSKNFEVVKFLFMLAECNEADLREWSKKEEDFKLSASEAECFLLWKTRVGHRFRVVTSDEEDRDNFFVRVIRRNPMVSRK